MSNFAGRRAPNVSQYLANLNVIPSEHDQQQEATYSIADDLNLFTNTEFFNWDLNEEMNSPGNGGGNGDSTAVGAKKGGHETGNGNGVVASEGLDFPSGKSHRCRRCRIQGLSWIATFPSLCRLNSQSCDVIVARMLIHRVSRELPIQRTSLHSL